MLFEPCGPSVYALFRPLMCPEHSEEIPFYGLGGAVLDYARKRGVWGYIRDVSGGEAVDAR